MPSSTSSSTTRLTRSSEYEDDEVEDYERIFDQFEIYGRIDRGLVKAYETLLALPATERSINALDGTTIFAVFEALSCERLISNEALVKEKLLEPFRLMQERKPLQVNHYVPAMTQFLFDPDAGLRAWAMSAWTRTRPQLTASDFDFAIQSPLERVLLVAAMAPTADPAFVERFWQGMRTIVQKLDADLITHSLRAMEIDTCRLTLDHLQLDSPGLRYLMQTIEILLIRGPKDFWEAMGAIPPTTVVEQVFNNPQYIRYVQAALTAEGYDQSPFRDMLAWVRPFMQSLQDSQQPAACRALTSQLLEHFQGLDTPEYARTQCYSIGLAVLNWNLTCCNKHESLDTVNRIAASETLALVSQYIPRILAIPTLPANDISFLSLNDSCLRVIKSAMALECKTLRTHQELLKRHTSLPQSFDSRSPDIWDAVVSKLRRGNIGLATAALSGINDLTGLENFIIKEEGLHADEKREFNMLLRKLTHLVCQMLERINDFDPDDLDRLFRKSESSNALLASLFSAETSTYEAGIELVKSVSGESARKEAISHLLQPFFFETSLNSFSWTMQRITIRKTFAACPRMLKTSRDVIDVLCDTQDGVLRLRPLQQTSEIKAVESFWEHQWIALKMIYESTEGWSRQGHDSAMMKDFCRDTMDFSEHFFDQFGIFASAMDAVSLVKLETASTISEQASNKKTLLTHPARTMETMVKFLRLRDEYLARTCVKLISKVLDRLRESKLTLSSLASEQLEKMILGTIRTILEPQQKAELRKALEGNLGRSIITLDSDQNPSDKSREQSVNGRGEDIRTGSTTSKPKTGSKLAAIDMGAWSKNAKKARDIVEISDGDLDDSKVTDADLLAMSTSVELARKQFGSHGLPPKQTPNNEQPSHSALVKGPPHVRPKPPSVQDQLAFRDKRAKEKEAKEKRDREAAAKSKRHLLSQAAGFGEGSALSKMGVMGKDHTPKGMGIMMSSDESSDSSDDDEADETLLKRTKHTSAYKSYLAGKSRQAEVQKPVKKTKLVRSAKDMRARLAPDLTPLHKTILSWEFFHKGELPPMSTRQNYTLVTSSFAHPVEYQNTFKPLLELEAWQGFLKSKEEGFGRSFEIKVSNRLTVDSFIEVSTTMDMADGKDLGIAEADIILISKAQDPTSDPNQSHCLARVFKIVRRKSGMEISYRVIPNNPLLSAFVPKAVLRGVKVSSITPLEREYGALSGLQYYDLCDEIVKGRASPLLKYHEKQVEPLMKQYKLNCAQAKAVKSAIDNDAFTLIQGPPGSGKTKTIIAIVGALLSDTLKSTATAGTAIAVPVEPGANRKNQVTAPAPKKLLVCAPSNAAVDELVMRLKQGVKTVRGVFHKISVIRLGRSDNINANVKDVTLDELVTQKLAAMGSTGPTRSEEIHKVMMLHKEASEAYQELRKERETATEGRQVEISRQCEILSRKKQQLSNQIDKMQDEGNTAARDADIRRRQVQQEILDSSHVLCATLSGSGHDMFQNLKIDFETVVIDEAAQSIELSALIPLKYGCAKCIMVGDPKQLPPTVLSREAARFQYEQSLFVRMQKNGPDDVHLLDTQYRMHPDISAFPSRAFYEGRLLDGDGMSSLRVRPWHRNPMLGPYRFFNVQGYHQSSKGHSLINTAELDVALQLFERLQTDHKGLDLSGKVGIITPYKSQLRELRSRFVARYGESIFKMIEFNTTDAFQGRESEIIIFSCVRASANQGIGFLSDIRRMNVGITRAKSSLWVLGNAQSLARGEYWNRLIEDAKERKFFIDGDVLKLLKVPGPISRGDSQAGISEDIEMTDVSGLDVGAESVAQHSTRRESEGVFETHSKSTSSYGQGSTVTKPNSRDEYLLPAGNGLNYNSACVYCGSLEHRSGFCDNQHLEEVVIRCHRCHAADHRASDCKAVRCLDCGKFGHRREACTTTHLLSKTERDSIRKQERNHESQRARALEMQRNRNMGSHDLKVPTVRTANDSSASDTGKERDTDRHKRKRENSPPRSRVLAHPPKDARKDAHSGLSRHKEPGKSVEKLPASRLDSSKVHGVGEDKRHPGAMGHQGLSAGNARSHDHSSGVRKDQASNNTQRSDHSVRRSDGDATVQTSSEVQSPMMVSFDIRDIVDEV